MTIFWVIINYEKVVKKTIDNVFLLTLKSNLVKSYSTILMIKIFIKELFFFSNARVYRFTLPVDIDIVLSVVNWSRPKIFILLTNPIHFLIQNKMRKKIALIIIYSKFYWQSLFCRFVVSLDILVALTHSLISLQTFWG